MSSIKNVLCFDLGGTNLRAAVVSAQGEILQQNRLPVRSASGFQDLLKLFSEVTAPLRRVGLDWQVVSVASAGPLDPVRGVLLDPTNFLTDAKGWGVLPLVQELETIFQQKVFLENDAAAALLAESWKGAARGLENVTLMTLGTGVGTAFLANGSLVRAGRNLHTEASHIPLNAWEKAHSCACGAFGCIESYLAGPHFASFVAREIGRAALTGEELAHLAQNGDSEVLRLFERYGEWLALSVRALSMIFASEIVVLGGGFSSNSKFFLESARQSLPALFARHREGVDMLPQVVVSPIADVAGLLGAARVALQS